MNINFFILNYSIHYLFNAAKNVSNNLKSFSQNIFSPIIRYSVIRMIVISAYISES